MTKKYFSEYCKIQHVSTNDTPHTIIFACFSWDEMSGEEKRPGHLMVAAAAKLLQSCLTLCDPMDCSLPGFSPWDSPGKNTEMGCHFLLQAWKWKVKVKLLSRVWLLATPWTAAYQVPLSMGFSRHEYRSGVPLPSPQLMVKYPLKKGDFFFFFFDTDSGFLNVVCQNGIKSCPMFWLNSCLYSLIRSS